VADRRTGWRPKDLDRVGIVVLLENVVTCDYISSMRVIGIRELKARLSQTLREVARGEVVLVTDRGRVVAEIRTPTEPLAQETAFERGLRRLAAQGGLRESEQVERASYPKSPLRTPRGTGRDLLDAEREER